MAEFFPKTGSKNKPNKITNVVIEGRGNYVNPTAENVIVNGDSNSIGYNVKDSSILGSSGCTIMAGLKNVQIINSSGVIATEDGMVCINNTVENTLLLKTLVTGSVDAVSIFQPNNTTLLIKVDVIGVSEATTDNYAGYHLGFYRCESLSTAVMSLYTSDSFYGNASSATISTSGQFIVININGVSGAMNWKIKYSYQII